MTYSVIAGIDPSLTSTGIAVKDWDGNIATHRVRSTGKKTDSWNMRNNRIQGLATAITNRIPGGALVVIEAPSYGSISTSAHDRSGLWWTIYDQLIDNECTIVPATPAQRMMYATGKGGGKDAGKDNVLAQTIRRYPNIDITGNDIADAVIFLAIGLRLTGQPLETDLPKTHLNALNKLQLPHGPDHNGPVQPLVARAVPAGALL